MLIKNVCDRVFAYCENKELITIEEVVKNFNAGKNIHFTSDTISYNRGNQYIYKVQQYIKSNYSLNDLGKWNEIIL